MLSPPLSEAAEFEELDAPAARSLTPLVGIGCRSGDTVLGLSAVRQTRRLAYVLVDGALSRGTMAEIARLRRFGVRIFKIGHLSVLTRMIGREDVKVVGIKSGHLARGIEKKLVTLI